MRVYRTEEENRAGGQVAEIFDANPESTEIKLENFPKYARRTFLKRFLSMYEVFKLAMWAPQVASGSPFCTKLTDPYALPILRYFFDLLSCKDTGRNSTFDVEVQNISMILKS